MRSDSLLHGPAARERLATSRLLLLFCPELCGERSPLEALEAALPYVDLVQVRPKPLGPEGSKLAPCSARATWEWSLRILDLQRRPGASPIVLTVDDRVDVALALREQGVAGVHLGQDDLRPRAARALLGREALIGYSTHDLEQVEQAANEPVDYLGFGPVHATRTKGYGQGLGAALCCAAAAAAHVPLFAIGGIDRTNAGELARVGRAAISSAILCADDPASAARELRDLLRGSTREPGPQGKSSIASP